MILNLTQHAPTADQITAGVVEPADKAALQALLTFEEMPTVQEILQHASELGEIARKSGLPAAMIGGAPFFMGPLERALKEVGVQALYSFTKRESADVKLPDGSVKKTQVFKHVGFVEAAMG